MPLVGRAACSKPGNSHPPAEAPLSLWARGSRGGADVELLPGAPNACVRGEFREVPGRSGVLPEMTGVAGPGHLVFWPYRGLKELVGGYMLSLSDNLIRLKVLRRLGVFQLIVGNSSLPQRNE